MKLVSNQSCFDSGGWVGFKTMVVTQKIKETDDITSFIIQNLNGEPLPDFKPGKIKVNHDKQLLGNDFNPWPHCG